MKSTARLAAALVGVSMALLGAAAPSQADSPGGTPSTDQHPTVPITTTNNIWKCC